MGRSDDIPEEQTFQLEAIRSGIVHAVVATWEVWSDPERTSILATHLKDGPDSPWSSIRDGHFSQGIQVIEDFDRAPKGEFAAPVPFIVTEGEPLLLHVRHNSG